MNSKTKIGLGSSLAAAGALAMVLSILLKWTEAPRPWGFLLGFATGVAAGLGAALAVSGLIDQRQKG